jgi:hypothetical protein
MAWLLQGGLRPGRQVHPVARLLWFRAYLTQYSVGIFPKGIPFAFNPMHEGILTIESKHFGAILRSCLDRHPAWVRPIAGDVFGDRGNRRGSKHGTVFIATPKASVVARDLHLDCRLFRD